MYITPQLWVGAFGLDRAWIGIVPLGLGALFGYAAYQKAQVRRYSVARVVYSHKDRLKRAWKYWAFGGSLLAFAWGYQLGHDQFADYWWYAWPVLFPLFVGTRLYLLRGEVALTPAAAKAKSHYEALEQKAATEAAEPGPLDKVLASRWARYPAAAALLYGSYYFAFVDTSKNAGTAALALLVLACLCAYEAAVAVLVVSLVMAIGWALFAGVSAIPVSVAIIVGALIIAAALRR
jgi:hypothetical protein